VCRAGTRAGGPYYETTNAGGGERSQAPACRSAGQTLTPLLPRLPILAEL